MIKNYTAEELLVFLYGHWGLTAPSIVGKINHWLSRGDGAAIYINRDFGSRELGQPQIVSYGGPESQLERPDPPETLPDIGGRINWRYQLEGTYRGESLPMIEVGE